VKQTAPMSTSPTWDRYANFFYILHTKYTYVLMTFTYLNPKPLLSNKKCVRHSNEPKFLFCVNQSSNKNLTHAVI
jgi:hypothetical protein